MKSNTVNIILVICLIVIAVLLTILIMKRNIPTPKPNTKPEKQLLQPQTPYIVESPYYYDSGYWLDPRYWWYGDDYYRRHHSNNNHNHNYNHNYNHNQNHNQPTHSIQPTHPTMPVVQPTLGQITPTVGNRLPRPQLIAPSEDSVFPLPTLASPIHNLPEQIHLESDLPVFAPPIPQPPVEMSNHRLPIVDSVSNVSTMPDNRPALVDMQASQNIGMSGNNPLNVQEIQPVIAMQH